MTETANKPTVEGEGVDATCADCFPVYIDPNGTPDEDSYTDGTVRLCPKHASVNALIAALKGLMNQHGHVEGCPRTSPPHDSRPCRVTCEAARAALTKGTKQQ